MPVVTYLTCPELSLITLYPPSEGIQLTRQASFGPFGIQAGDSIQQRKSKLSKISGQMPC
jgi:hypothetical protein